jgi:hypothetical protein
MADEEFRDIIPNHMIKTGLLGTLHHNFAYHKFLVGGVFHTSVTLTLLALVLGSSFIV